MCRPFKFWSDQCEFLIYYLILTTYNKIGWCKVLLQNFWDKSASTSWRSPSSPLPHETQAFTHLSPRQWYGWVQTVPGMHGVRSLKACPGVPFFGGEPLPSNLLVPPHQLLGRHCCKGSGIQNMHSRSAMALAGSPNTPLKQDTLSKPQLPTCLMGTIINSYQAFSSTFGATSLVSINIIALT